MSNSVQPLCHPHPARAASHPYAALSWDRVRQWRLPAPIKDAIQCLQPATISDTPASSSTQLPWASSPRLKKNESTCLPDLVQTAFRKRHTARFAPRHCAKFRHSVFAAQNTCEPEHAVSRFAAQHCCPGCGQDRHAPLTASRPEFCLVAEP